MKGLIPKQQRSILEISTAPRIWSVDIFKNRSDSVVDNLFGSWDDSCNFSSMPSRAFLDSLFLKFAHWMFCLGLNRSYVIPSFKIWFLNVLVSFYVIRKLTKIIKDFKISCMSLSIKTTRWCCATDTWHPHMGKNLFMQRKGHLKLIS